MSYRNTLQADALKLVAKKLQSSLAVEGELPEDGLAAYGDDGDDLMMALARKIVSGEEEDETRRWRRSSPRPGTPRPPPRSCWWTTAGRSSSRAGGRRGQRQRGHHADGIGPTVELVPVNGHANGQRGLPGQRERQRPPRRSPEPQQSLFSWAEFMAEEPVKPKGRKRKPQPATLSMFEWAMEQEREEEPVGAGR